MSDKTGPEADQFAADFRDSASMAQEWIEGRGDLPDLLHIVRDMPRGALGGLEAGFLSRVDTAVRGDRLGAANAPDPAKAQQLLEATPSEEAPPLPPVDLDAFHRRRLERERAARFEELARRNQALFMEQQQAFAPGRDRPKGADWS